MLIFVKSKALFQLDKIHQRQTSLALKTEVKFEHSPPEVEVLAESMIPKPTKHNAPITRTMNVCRKPPLILTLNNKTAMKININALTNSIKSFAAILPPIIVETDVGVMNNLASSPVSRSPAIVEPIPNIQLIIIVIPKIAGTKKSIYLIFP